MHPFYPKAFVTANKSDSWRRRKSVSLIGIDVQLVLKTAMALTREELLSVATLARLRLTPQEEEQLANQLDKILQYMAKLNQLDTKEIEPFIHTVDPVNSLREDCVTNQPNAEGILANAPAKKESFFQVPKILE